MSDRLRVLDELGAELERAARCRSPKTAWRTARGLGVRASRWGRLIAALAAGAVVAVALAVAALVLLAAHPRSPRPSLGAGVPAGARPLLRELAVLRRPPRAADRTLAPAVAATLPGRVIPSLTRLEASVRAGSAGTFRIYLVVLGIPGCQAAVPERRPRYRPARYWAALVTVAASGSGAAYGPGGWGYAVQYAASESPQAAAYPGGGNYAGDLRQVGVYATLVPDGVTDVHWTLGPRARGARAQTIQATVRDNLAFAAVSGNPGTERVLWRTADGRTIAPRRQEALLFCGQTPALTPGGARVIDPGSRRELGLLRSRALAHPLSIGAFYAGIFAAYRLGLNFAQARFVPTRVGIFGPGSGVWVVPGSGGLCLMEGTRAQGYGGGNGSCGKARPDGGAVAAASIRFSDRLGHGRNAYFGLVPDGNRSVEVVLADGAVRRVAVHDNLYAFALAGRAVAVWARDARGSRVRVPLSVNENMF